MDRYLELVLICLTEIYDWESGFLQTKFLIFSRCKCLTAVFSLIGSISHEFFLQIINIRIVRSPMINLRSTPSRQVKNRTLMGFFLSKMLKC